MGKPTNVPPPIIPNRGGSFTYRPPTPAPTPEDWKHWAKVPEPYLWELILLSLNIEPSKFEAPALWTNFALRGDAGYKTRLDLCERNKKTLHPEATRGFAPRWEMPVAQFVSFAQRMEWSVPPELTTIAAASPQALPAATPAPKAPKATTKATVKGPKAEGRYKRQSPGDDLPRLKSAELASVFRDADPKRDWRRTTQDNQKNQLCEVARTESKGRGGYGYCPEGIALWLTEQLLTGNLAKRVDRYKVAAAMIDHIGDLIAEGRLIGGRDNGDLAAKLEYWEEIQSR